MHCGLCDYEWPYSKWYRQQVVWKAIRNVSNLLGENEIENRKCIMEQDISNHANSEVGAPRLLPFLRVVATSVSHSCFPFPAFLIWLSDFETLIRMSSISVRWGLHVLLTSPSLCRSVVGVIHLDRSAQYWMVLNYSQKQSLLMFLSRCRSLMD